MARKMTHDITHESACPCTPQSSHLSCVPVPTWRTAQALIRGMPFSCIPCARAIGAVQDRRVLPAGAGHKHCTHASWPTPARRRAHAPSSALKHTTYNWEALHFLRGRPWHRPSCSVAAVGADASAICHMASLNPTGTGAQAAPHRHHVTVQGSKPAPTPLPQRRCCCCWW